MKRTIIFGLFLLLGGMALAAPTAFNGIYQFRGQVNPLARQTIDVIDNRAADASTRLKILQAAGAQCVHANSVTVRCVSHGRAGDIPRASLDRLARQAQGLRVEMGPTMGPAAVVSKGDVVTEWMVPQRGRWNGGAFERYRYFELSGGLMKVQLPGSLDGLWLNVENAKTLRRYDSVITADSRWRWHIDSAEAILLQD